MATHTLLLILHIIKLKVISMKSKVLPSKIKYKIIELFLIHIYIYIIFITKVININIYIYTYISKK